MLLRLLDEADFPRSASKDHANKKPPVATSKATAAEETLDPRPQTLVEVVLHSCFMLLYGCCATGWVFMWHPDDFEAQRELERSSFKLLAVWAKGKEINIGRKFAGEKKKLYTGANQRDGALLW